MPARIDPADLPRFPGLLFEKKLWEQGLKWVGGVDEAGRGAWAGPVAAAVVVLPPDEKVEKKLSGVRDSKQMTAKQRETWADTIKDVCLAWGVGYASPGEIDEIGIMPATRLAAWRAIEKLKDSPDHLLLDYLFLPEVEISQTSLIKGDRRSLSVAAASILAKTSRDALMRELNEEIPGYGFGQHKGYGTRKHQEAIRKLGLCAVHRKSWKYMEE